MRRFVSLMIFVLVCLFVAGSTLFTQTKAPDLIMVNAKIYTVDSRFSTAEAVAIADGKFTAVGTTAQIRKLSGRSTRILDAGGKTIAPGLQDNHLHNTGGGPGVDLFNARTVQDVLDRIGSRAREAKPGDVVVTNADWHEQSSIRPARSLANPISWRITAKPQMCRLNKSLRSHLRDSDFPLTD